MNNKEALILECGTLNRVFAAFFMNECCIKEGIDFNDSKPIMPNIASLNESGRFFCETDQPHGLKRFFHGKVVIENIDLEKFRSSGIYNFFDDSMKSNISDCAHDFAKAAQENKHCDFVFSSLPDEVVHIFDCVFDPETNFRSRLIIGQNFGDMKFTAVWEFYCLLMSKFREGDPHPIYGTTYKNMDEAQTKQELN